MRIGGLFGRALKITMLQGTIGFIEGSIQKFF
jgi:hypothetical protein